MSNPESLPGFSDNTELPGAAQHAQLPGMGNTEADMAPDVITTEVHSASLSALMAANEVLVTNLEASLRDAITAADAAAQQNVSSSPAGFNPIR
jgi:hypothetical protein